MIQTKKVLEGQTIAVWVSCGAASAAAAVITLKKYGEMCKVRLLNNPVAEEHEDNQRFINDLSVLLNHSIEPVLNPDWPSCSIFDVFEKRKYISGVHGAPCTGELKKKARQNWEKSNHVDWHVMGFSIEEKNRHNRFVLTEKENVIPVLIEECMTKDDCGKMLISLGINLPEAYSLGMPNANCVGCVKATSPTYWNLIRKIDICRFNKICKVSRGIGTKLVRFNGKRIFLDELPEWAVGEPIKEMNLECGFFCEEKWK